MQLPPKRRQIISLQLKRSDIISAMALCEVVESNASRNEDTEDGPLEISDEPEGNLKDISGLVVSVFIYSFLCTFSKFLCTK